MKIIMKLCQDIPTEIANKLCDEITAKLRDDENGVILIDSRIGWPVVIVKDDGDVVEAKPENMAVVRECLKK